MAMRYQSSPIYLYRVWRMARRARTDRFLGRGSRAALTRNADLNKCMAVDNLGGRED